MDRFSISLKKDPSQVAMISPYQKSTNDDPDYPPEGTPYRVVTHELKNSEMNHPLYMEALNFASQFCCDAGSIGDTLFSVRLIMNVITEKFEIQLVFLKQPDAPPVAIARLKSVSISDVISLR